MMATIIMMLMMMMMLPLGGEGHEHAFTIASAAYLTDEVRPTTDGRRATSVRTAHDIKIK